MRRTETPKPIWIKFCMVVDIPAVVKYTNFGDHRLRGFWVAGGQIFPSPIDFHRRPYNTLALPCERVIFPFYSWLSFSDCVAFLRHYSLMLNILCGVVLTSECIMITCVAYRPCMQANVNSIYSEPSVCVRICSMLIVRKPEW